MANITNGTVTVQVTGGVGPYQYTLLNAGNNNPVPQNAYPTFTNPVNNVVTDTFKFGDTSDSTGNSGLQAGSYIVKIVDSNLCETLSSVLVVSNATPSPTATPVPMPTSTPVPDPTATVVPDPTSTPDPTATVVPDPTATVVPDPTATVVPDPTATVVPDPTSTPVPDPTSTPVPDPTATVVPDPTATVVPPTSTPVPDPTATVVPDPTSTPVPDPTATVVPDPTSTLVPDPTSTPVPDPTATVVPPTSTPVPDPTSTPVPDSPGYAFHLGNGGYPYAQDLINDPLYSSTSGASTVDFATLFTDMLANPGSYESVVTVPTISDGTQIVYPISTAQNYYWLLLPDSMGIPDLTQVSKLADIQNMTPDIAIAKLATTIDGEQSTLYRINLQPTNVGLTIQYID